MSLTQELKSWTYGMTVDVKPFPGPGTPAPSSAKLSFPRPSGKPALIVFLRHCGCPFAERDFLALRKVASENPGIECIAVSHSSTEHTAKWLAEVGGAASGNGAGASRNNKVEVIVDDSRQLHADWGLGIAGWMHLLAPGGLYSLYQLARDTGIKNRPTESGSRWQTGGYFAVTAPSASPESSSVVTWALKPDRADQEPDWQAAVVSMSAKK